MTAIPTTLTPLMPLYTPWYRQMEQVNYEATMIAGDKSRGVNQWVIDSGDNIHSFALFCVKAGTITPEAIKAAMNAGTPQGVAGKLCKLVADGLTAYLHRELETYEIGINQQIDKIPRLNMYWHTTDANHMLDSNGDNLTVEVGSRAKNIHSGDEAFGLFTFPEDFDVIKWDISKITDPDARLALRKVLQGIGDASPYMETGYAFQYQNEMWLSELGYDEEPEAFNKFAKAFNENYEALAEYEDDAEELLAAMSLSEYPCLQDTLNEIMSAGELADLINESQAVDENIKAFQGNIREKATQTQLLKSLKRHAKKDPKLLAVSKLLSWFLDTIDFSLWDVNSLGDNLGDIEMYYHQLISLGDCYDDDQIDRSYNEIMEMGENATYYLTNGEQLEGFVGYLKQHLVFMKMAHILTRILE